MDKRQYGLWYHLLDVLLNIVVIVAIVTVIRTFLVSPFQVEGSSMLDTLKNDEYIIINKWTYIAGSPQRGDIVVFRPPNVDHGKHYVKRVIGLPGDEVIIRSGKVFLRPGGGKEVELPEPYLNDQNRDRTFSVGGSQGEVRYLVPPEHFFLLGDNRLGSLDSRAFKDVQNLPTPFVPEDDINGKVWFVALPLKEMREITVPDYGI